MTLTRAGLELSFPRKLQTHNSNWDTFRFQQHEIRRPRVQFLASIGERGPARVALGIAPHMAAGRDIAALDERTAADEIACCPNRININ